MTILNRLTAQKQDTSKKIISAKRVLEGSEQNPNDFSVLCYWQSNSTNRQVENIYPPAHIFKSAIIEYIQLLEKDFETLSNLISDIEKSVSELTITNLGGISNEWDIPLPTLKDGAQ